jgi:hypothetical protein
VILLRKMRTMRIVVRSVGVGGWEMVKTHLCIKIFIRIHNNK